MNYNKYNSINNKPRQILFQDPNYMNYFQHHLIKKNCNFAHYMNTNIKVKVACKQTKS